MQARHLTTLESLLTMIEEVTKDGGGAEGTTAVIARNSKQLARLRCEQSSVPARCLLTLMGSEPLPLAQELADLPALALVIDTRPPAGPLQSRLFEEAYFALVPGGRWVALLADDTPRESDGTDGAAGGPDDHPQKPIMRRLARAFRPLEKTSGVRPRWRAHERSTDRVLLTSQLAVFRKDRSHLVKVRDADAVRVLGRREPDLDVVEIGSHEPSVLTTHDHVEHGAVPSRHQLPDVVASPRLALRRYDGTVTMPLNALSYHGRSVLPESFRWPLAEVPTAHGLRDAGSRFARLKTHAEPQHLPGSYFHLGYNNPGHYGHLMTEALAKLWGWDAAKADDPSLKVLCHLQRNGARTGAERLESRLLPAYGIDLDDIVWAQGPVSVERLYGCTPMWHNTEPFYAHHGLRDDWARVRDGLLRDATHPAEAEQIFVSRHGGNRSCRNVAEVEQLFESAGYTVVLPGAMSLPDQAALFAGARVVAGFGGTGMFNLAYARRLEAVVVLNQSAYEARNEQLYAAVHGVACHTFWSPPDIDHPRDGRDYDAHQSDWEFDLGLSDDLREVLGSL